MYLKTASIRVSTDNIIEYQTMGSFSILCNDDGKCPIFVVFMTNSEKLKYS